MAKLKMTGSFALRPEHIRLNTPGELQANGTIQAVQYQGAATRFELKLNGGEKLLVSQANMTGEEDTRLTGRPRSSHSCVHVCPAGSVMLLNRPRSS